MTKLLYLKKGLFVLLQLINILFQLYIILSFVLFPVFNWHLEYYLEGIMVYQIIIWIPFYFIVQLILMKISKKKFDLVLLLVLITTICGFGLPFLNLHFLNDNIFIYYLFLIPYPLIIIYYLFYFFYSIYNFYKYLKSLRAKA